MIKLAVISDIHLGFGEGTERAPDSYDNAKQAFDILIKEEPDIILVLGDIFHEKIPKPEVLGKAIDLFSYVKRELKIKKAVVTKSIKNDKVSTERHEILPVVTIWGTHERRAGDAVNPVQILEKAGLVSTLHAESVLVEVGSDRVGLHGLSGVPDNYARSILSSWNPQLFTDVPNIFMIHQSFKELIRGNDESFLTLGDLPAGFNLYLLGHIHWNTELKHPSFGTPVLVPGSTVKTQLTKYESQKQKGVYIIKLAREKGDVKFLPIKTRPFFYNEISVDKKKPAEVLAEMSNLISKYLKEIYSKKPIIRIKLIGKLSEGSTPADLVFNLLYKEFGDRAILSLDKSDVVSSELEKNSSFLNEIKENKSSIDQIGIRILCKTMKENDIKKVEELLDFLAEGNLEKAREKL